MLFLFLLITKGEKICVRLCYICAIYVLYICCAICVVICFKIYGYMAILQLMQGTYGNIATHAGNTCYMAIFYDSCKGEQEHLLYLFVIISAGGVSLQGEFS